MHLFDVSASCLKQCLTLESRWHVGGHNVAHCDQLVHRDAFKMIAAGSHVVGDRKAAYFLNMGDVSVSCSLRIPCYLRAEYVLRGAIDHGTTAGAAPYSMVGQIARTRKHQSIAPVAVLLNYLADVGFRYKGQLIAFIGPICHTVWVSPSAYIRTKLRYGCR